MKIQSFYYSYICNIIHYAYIFCIFRIYFFKQISTIIFYFKNYQDMESLEYIVTPDPVYRFDCRTPNGI